MAGKFIEHKAGSITAATATGYITLASVAGFYKNAIVFLVDSGGANHKRCVITEIVSTSNQLGIRFQETAAGSVPSYGRNNVSAYNGGVVTQHEQVVYNINDKPLD
jgi:hypothetical protein